MKYPVLIPNIFNFPFTYESDLDLKVGDYVYVQVWQNNDSSANFIGSNGTGFMGYKIA